MWIFNIVPANATRNFFQGFLVQLDIRQLRQVRLGFHFGNVNAFKPLPAPSVLQRFCTAWLFQAFLL